MSIITAGIGLANNVFAVHSFNDTDKADLTTSLPPCVIGMEDYSGAHHWERLSSAYDHTVRLMASKFVAHYLTLLLLLLLLVARSTLIR